uniref:Reverse transcriptase domain-containing protein n=1 Tax=Cajanus cajan TaxID=3821 RepID=A0A151UGD6_CAJCA
MRRNVSALIGKPIPHIPDKCKDPGTFTIPCIIGDRKFANALLDLGASINVMPMSIFNSLSLGPLKPIGVVIQLANRSTAHPTGVIEDVLVRVDKLIFPADFYVLHMEEWYSHGAVPIILGRPFLNTTRTKIDVYASTLSMEFDDSVVRFNIHDAMKHPSEEHSVFHVDLFNELIDEYVLQFFHNVDSSPLACIDYELCSSYIDIDVDVDIDIDVGMNTNESDSFVEM